MMRRRMPRAGSDDGSILLLTIFYAVLALALILVVVAATSLYLDRKRLFTLADGAALAGAEAYPLDAMQPGLTTARLAPADIADAVDEYLRLAPQAGLEGVSVTRAASVDGTSATVTLRAWWRPPVLTLVLPAGVPLEVTAVARSVVRFVGPEPTGGQ